MFLFTAWFRAFVSTWYNFARSESSNTFFPRISRMRLCTGINFSLIAKNRLMVLPTELLAPQPFSFGQFNMNISILKVDGEPDIIKIIKEFLILNDVKNSSDTRMGGWVPKQVKKPRSDTITGFFVPG